MRNSYDDPSNLGVSPSDRLGFWSTIGTLVTHYRLLTVGPLVAGVAAVGATYLIEPKFTARTSFIPPQQQQSAAAATIASMGALANIAGGTLGAVRTPADQYVALIQSTRIADKIIDKFDLMKVYDSDFRMDARRSLSDNIRVTLSRREGIIAIEVDDTSPKRAADIANSFVAELQELTGSLALTEAQQRRLFFEAQLNETKGRLRDAQAALQAAGFNDAALRVEPRTAAEAYTKLKTELNANEVRLQGLLLAFSEASQEVVRQRSVVASLRGQLLRIEAADSMRGGTDYVSRFREFKYQESLFELFSRQFESARLDESKDGMLVQVIDIAAPPERKSSPKRGLTGLATSGAALAGLLSFVLLRQAWRESRASTRS